MSALCVFVFEERGETQRIPCLLSVIKSKSNNILNKSQEEAKSDLKESNKTY